MVKFIIALIAVGLIGVSQVDYKHSADPGAAPSNEIPFNNRRKIKKAVTKTAIIGI